MPNYKKKLENMLHTFKTIQCLILIISCTCITSYAWAMEADELPPAESEKVEFIRRNGLTRYWLSKIFSPHIVNQITHHVALCITPECKRFWLQSIDPPLSNSRVQFTHGDHVQPAVVCEFGSLYYPNPNQAEYIETMFSLCNVKLEPIKYAQLSPDHRIIVIVTQAPLHVPHIDIYTTSDGTPVSKIDTSNLHAVAFDPTNMLLALTKRTPSSDIDILDAQTLEHLQTIKDPRKDSNFARWIFSCDGNSLFAQDNDSPTKEMFFDMRLVRQAKTMLDNPTLEQACVILREYDKAQQSVVAHVPQQNMHRKGHKRCVIS